MLEKMDLRTIHKSLGRNIVIVRKKDGSNRFCRKVCSALTIL